MAVIVSRYGMRGGLVVTSTWYCVLHALEDVAHVQVAQAADDGLVDRGVVLDAERRVLGGELVQRFGDLLLVAAALGLDREAVHGRRELERHEVDVVLVVRVVQHGVEVDLLDLGHRADVAGHERVGLDEVLALQQVQVADLERLLAVADEELRVLGDRALVHAEDADLADERIDHHLEDVREHVLLRVGLGADRLRPCRLRPSATAAGCLRWDWA